MANAYVYTYTTTGSASANVQDKTLTGKITIVAQSGTNDGVAEANEIFTASDGSHYKMVSSTTGTNNKTFYDISSFVLGDGTIINAPSTSLHYMVFNIQPVDALGVATGSAFSIMTFSGATSTFTYTITAPGGTVTTQSTTLEALATQHGGIKSLDTRNSPLPGGTGANWLLSAQNLFCFMRGTLIETATGFRRIEEIAQGDLVRTKDNGYKPVWWIGGKTVTVTDANREKFSPVRIRAGALGRGIPEQDLYVSQQHRVLVKSRIAERITGADEVLVPAKKLLDFDGIDLVTDCDEITYIHMLFDRHEIVYSNGAETESLYTGPEALKAVGEDARAEILSLFPELSDLAYVPRAARVIPSGKQARQLADRHLRQSCALQ